MSILHNEFFEFDNQLGKQSNSYVFNNEPLVLRWQT
jgi:hypothetical protein